MSDRQTTTLRAEISALVERLRPYDTLAPPQGYWIEGPDGGMQYDPDGNHGASDWCEDHAEDLIMRLNLYTPGDGEYLLQAADTGGIYDTIPCCATCGITLAGWPTNYCRSEELCFFEDDPDWEPSPENIHVIEMVLWNLQWSDDTEALAAWKAIGDSAVEKLAAVSVPEAAR
jgi:hypothetical protein